MSYFDDVRNEVNKGREGGFQGIPIDLLPRLDDYLAGLQAGRVDLIGGDSGFGKTSLVDFIYLINPINSIANGLTDFKISSLNCEYDSLVDYPCNSLFDLREMLRLHVECELFEINKNLKYRKAL